MRIFLILICAVQAFALDEMISPAGHPTTFEDPRHSTEIRPLYVHHKIDDKFITEGGDVNIWALQARVKITDSFSFIATKDGYIDFNPKAGLENDEGFANLSAGFKYSPYMTDSEILTIGLRYEVPTGEKEVLQGEGDGLFNPFFSAGASFGKANLILGSGLRIPADSEDSQLFDFDIHFDYQLEDFYPLVELGVIHVLDEGKRLPLPGEGQDFFNFGSTEADSATMVIAGIGARYRICDDIDFGVIYQIPLNDNKDSYILEHRVTADMIYRFS